MTSEPKAKCELCNKEDKAIKMMLAGGPWTYLCEPCRKTVHRVVTRYLWFLLQLPFREVVGTFHKIQEEEKADE